MTLSGNADTGGETAGRASGDGPLSGLRVIDASTVLAGPNAARYLGDFGADVIKVERPGGDTLRGMAWKDHRDGVGLWWKLVNRNKRTIVLDLRADADRGVFCDLAAEADVLIENGRPGVLERLGVGPDVLFARNPELVIVRITGFGQDGPYAGRAGFASIAEGVSGLAALSGEPDGPPTLPAIALTDEVTGLAAAFASMVALRSGKGQVVDVNLLESVVQLLGPLPSVYAVNGEQQPRLGSGLPYTVPRGVYQCSDGQWVVVSTSSDTVAARVMTLLGLDHRPELESFDGRGAHRAELEGAMAAFCSQRTRDEVIAEFTAAEAAIGPIYDQADLAADPHVIARDIITDVGGLPQQNLIARLSATPGAIRWNGRPLDADGDGIRRHGWARQNPDTPDHV